MANLVHLTELRRGVEHWNQWRREHPDIVPDLGRAELQAASLGHADLRGARLWRADLSGADLTRADLGGANFRLARLDGASLRDANLRATIFAGTQLEGADLTGAAVWRTRFCALDLSHTTGLASLKHHGPSTIGLDTLMTSAPLPDEFLLGAGVPQWALPHVRRLTSDPTPPSQKPASS